MSDDQFAGFRIERELGRGGMGVVYLAEHVHLGRRVALKFLGPGLAETDDFRERFVRESRLAASLHHPNIVTVYDAGEAEGRLYIAMQYVEGTDLATVLSDEGALEPQRALAILEQIASALDAAHAEGLVHRDVKPANVLLRDAHAYLTDFGLTKRTTSGDLAHGDRPVRRHCPVHGAGADHGRRRRRTGRHLRARLHPLPLPDGRSAVRA